MFCIGALFLASSTAQLVQLALFNLQEMWEIPMQFGILKTAVVVLRVILDTVQVCFTPSYERFRD